MNLTVVREGQKTSNRIMRSRNSLYREGVKEREREIYIGESGIEREREGERKRQRGRKKERERE